MVESETELGNRGAAHETYPYYNRQPELPDHIKPPTPEEVRGVGERIEQMMDDLAKARREKNRLTLEQGHANDHIRFTI